MKNIVNILGGILLLVILLVVNQASQAESDNVWQNNDTSIHIAEQYSNPNLPIEYFNSVPCSPYQRQLSGGQTKDYCVVNTGSYMISSSGEVIVTGSSISHYLKNPANTNNRLIPLNNSPNVVQIANNSHNISIIYNAYDSLNIQKNKSVNNLFITSTNIQHILDPYNNNQVVNSSGLNVSANGEWLVGLNNKGIYKVNISTRQLQYIRKGEYNLNGLTANLKLAISNSGRYVAVYVGRNPSLEVVDTHACINTQASNGLDAKCDSNRFESIAINNIVPNIYKSATFRNVQFANDSTLSFYAITDWVDSTNYNVKKILLSASNNIDPASRYDYLALGDSYASGEGAYSYKDGTDEKLNKCHLSAVSYPYLIAKDGVTGKTESIACSGAKIKDLVNINNKKYDKDNPQSTAYTDPSHNEYVLQSFTPGNIRQLDFIDKYKPQNVTVSIGGNDIGFGKIVAKCVTDISECYNTKQDRQELINTIDNTYNNLVRTYQSIKKESAIGANVYVVGYPQVAKADGNCAANVKLTNNEIIFSNQLISYLNRVIKMAANQAGVKYIDVEHAFDGYRLCEAPSHALAINGLTAGNDGPLPGILNEIFNGPLGKESYHPNSLGHRLYTKAILAATNNFSEPMPNPVLDSPNAESAEKSALLDAVSTGYDVYGTTYYNDAMAPDYTTKNSQVPINLDSNTYNFKPNQSLSVVAYSEPTNLGTISTLSNGSVSDFVTVPDTLEPGYHTLKITGQTIFDTNVTVQKIIYVGASDQDIDGDGIPNEQETCLIGEASGIDQDKDGIDDACDGTILEAPVVPAPIDPPIDNQDPATPPPTNGGGQTPPPVVDSQPKTLKNIIQNKIKIITKTIQLHKNNFKPLFTMITSFVVTVLFSLKL